MCGLPHVEPLLGESEVLVANSNLLEAEHPVELIGYVYRVSNEGFVLKTNGIIISIYINVGN